MGYNTGFDGKIEIVPPLNPHEVEFLDRFAETRHVVRAEGPYAVYGNDARDQLSNEVSPEHPGFWCQWVPTASGDALIYNQEEKFYYSETWLAYLIDTFLRPGAAVTAERAEPVPGRFYPAAFEHFTFDHVLNGVIDAEGEEEDDLWRIEVRDNVVHVVRFAEAPGYDEIDPRSPGEWTGAEWAEYEARTLRNHVSVVSNGEIRPIGPAEENGFAPVEAP
ncbi:hypothetical protein [Actinoplanes couchii]|uniref:DUF427 domain-containing protein n=1 Tax=Actinoplanes couchii TaxID=403638 RepID=A0ABQ3X4I5_9ACTN|nr:hypothetical protein [Actinoplanes couchii]MDR6326211.1 hypothetical protein [Actinoplanes couchii]GID53436.1 hypothetical protein Aco03nite_018400 [Actinoplanes couchii]